MHTNTKDNKPSVYFNNLDALRALAAFAVIFFHISIYLKYPDTGFYNTLRTVLSLNYHGGFAGVFFFFVLSGFLITYLMFFEEAQTGKLRIGNFYVRRILRIWPLYFVSLIIGFVIHPIILKYLGRPVFQTYGEVMYSLFLTNFANISKQAYSGMLGVQWSVAIEEQFYFFWPLLFVSIKKKYFPFAMLLIIISSFIFYAVNSAAPKIRFYHTFSAMGYLSFGALMAFLSFFKQTAIENTLSKISKSGMLLIYIIGVVFLSATENILNVLHFPASLAPYVNRLLSVSFFSFIILEQIYSRNSFFKFGSIGVLTWLGKISYGLYLTHMIAIYIVKNLFSYQNIWIQISLSIALAILISYLSYRYFESYFLSLKNKFGNVKTE